MSHTQEWVRNNRNNNKNNTRKQHAHQIRNTRNQVTLRTTMRLRCHVPHISIFRITVCCDNIRAVWTQANLVDFARMDDALHDVDVGRTVRLLESSNTTIVRLARSWKLHGGSEQKVWRTLPTMLIKIVHSVST